MNAEKVQQLLHEERILPPGIESIVPYDWLADHFHDLDDYQPVLKVRIIDGPRQTTFLENGKND